MLFFIVKLSLIFKVKKIDAFHLSKNSLTVKDICVFVTVENVSILARVIFVKIEKLQPKIIKINEL